MKKTIFSLTSASVIAVLFSNMADSLPDAKIVISSCILCDKDVLPHDSLSKENLCSECIEYTGTDHDDDSQSRSDNNVKANDLATEIQVLRLELASKDHIIKMLVSDLNSANSEISRLKQECSRVEENATDSFTEVRSRPNKRKHNQSNADNVFSKNQFEILREPPLDITVQNNVTSATKSATHGHTKLNRPERNPSVVVFGDSMIRNTGTKIENSIVYCHPGIRTNQLEKKVQSNNNNTPKVVILHAGTNCLNSSPTPTDIMNDTNKLITTTRKTFPEAKICVSGILYRRDVDDRYIHAVNSCLDWACKENNVLFVDGNLWLNDSDLGYDGLHLNRKGTIKFGNLLNRVSKTLLSEN